MTPRLGIPARQGGEDVNLDDIRAAAAAAAATVPVLLACSPSSAR